MKQLYFLLFCLASTGFLNAQDTFSIVAVDSTTGEVGSAGCSCLGKSDQLPKGCFVISDVVPGKGAIHTQALYNTYNQRLAHDLMLQDMLPDDILFNVEQSDSDGTPEIRQYGIAIFDTAGHPRTAAFTGDNCSDYKGHRVGLYYSIQGNILLGPQILDSMEARFLRQSGRLAERLMAALQGANVPGADSRCLSEGIPGLTSFVRVAKPKDNANSFFLDLAVTDKPYGMSPIDSLQTLFNAWQLQNPQPSGINEPVIPAVNIYPNPSSSVCYIQFSDNNKKIIRVLDVLGKVLVEKECYSRTQFSTANLPKGTYIVYAENSAHKLIVE